MPALGPLPGGLPLFTENAGRSKRLARHLDERIALWGQSRFGSFAVLRPKGGSHKATAEPGRRAGPA
ncbi:MAG: hypothetical protein D6815_02450, partial [Candidatus Dadabacteria bacterium]